MFKNNVFKVSTSTSKWLKATVVRMIRTFASTMVASVPTTAATLGSINWAVAVSTSLTATVVIFFTCLAGIPEVESEDK